MDPRHVKNDNCSEHKEDGNQTSVNPLLPPPEQNKHLNQEPLLISNAPAIQILSQARNVNLCDLDNTGYYPEREDAFVTLMSKAEEKLRVNLLEVDPMISPIHVIPLQVPEVPLV
ncbi:27612_t:CDS:2 [Gigaspora margarita]|uniref:27612_t:CDS:1 n=1 Tax=Gigaspora margarita TaxID=4874 RepID=A0ABM8W3D5_GIGMA|nr:27612_t:CDS:2 [Gigaspora margarita]